MADEIPSLQIDTDWKKQAQEEKRKLAEQEKQREQQAVTASAGSVAGAAAAPREGRGRDARELPPASLASLVQSIVTQALFNLGDIAMRGSEPVVNLDVAKHHVDTLAILEEKTANNLSPEEKKLIDSALYEVRMRYVNVASQYIS